MPQIKKNNKVKNKNEEDAHHSGTPLPTCTLWRQASQLHTQTMAQMAMGYELHRPGHRSLWRYEPYACSGSIAMFHGRGVW